MRHFNRALTPIGTLLVCMACSSGETEIVTRIPLADAMPVGGTQGSGNTGNQGSGKLTQEGDWSYVANGDADKVVVLDGNTIIWGVEP